MATDPETSPRARSWRRVRPDRLRPVAGLALALHILAGLPSPLAAQADLIVAAGRAWTGEADARRAEAVAVEGERIVAVGTLKEVLAHRGEGTRVVARADGFLMAGFIDSHTHFERAGDLLLGVDLLAVEDEAGLVAAVEAARDRLPPRSWIVGGDWGAYAAWARGSTGREEDAPPAAGPSAAGPSSAGPSATGPSTEGQSEPFLPHRAIIDPSTPRNPVLLSRWDRELWLANGRALELAGATCDWPGVECDEGRTTGRLAPEAADRVRAAMPPKSEERRLAESRAALARLAEAGVTTIHDITGAEQMRIFQELRRRGELTVRVDARPTLDHVGELAALGLEHGFGDAWLRLGGLKGFVDGIMGNSSARFYEPYLTTGERGSWRAMMEPEGNLLRLLLAADAAGLEPHVHAIGDEAIDRLLDLFAEVIETGPPRERRFRVIHAQVLRGPEVAERMAELGVIAEVQPYHAIDDMRWMEERIGERARWAYAFRTLREAGVPLAFGSDWPGTNASRYPPDPLLGIYAAVTRQTLDGAPAEGWFPEERIDLESALVAYTAANARAAGQEETKGTLAPGKLADLVLLDLDPFAMAPGELDEVEVVLTVVGGRVVFDGDRPPH